MLATRPMRLAPESKTSLWRSERWVVRGCWSNSSRVSFMQSSLASGGKGALPTALLAYSVRLEEPSGRAKCGRFSATPRGRADGGTHRPCEECIDRTGATQREKPMYTGVRGRDVSVSYFAHILLYHWSEEACTLQAC